MVSVGSVVVDSIGVVVVVSGIVVVVVESGTDVVVVCGSVVVVVARLVVVDPLATVSPSPRLETSTTTRVSASTPATIHGNHFFRSPFVLRPSSTDGGQHTTHDTEFFVARRNRWDDWFHPLQDLRLRQSAHNRTLPGDQHCVLEVR